MLKKECINNAILSYYTFIYLSKQGHNDFYIAQKHHDTYSPYHVAQKPK